MSDLAFLGKKFIKPLSAAEVAKIIGTSRTKLFEYLREKGIVYKRYNRNIPSDLYIRKGWVEPKQSVVYNNGFQGTVLTTIFTDKGLREITKDILLNHLDLVHTLSYDNFWFILNNRIKSKLREITDYRDGEYSELIRKNSILFTDKETNNKTLFYYHNNNKIELIKYNVEKRQIYGEKTKLNK